MMENKMKNFGNLDTEYKLKILDNMQKDIKAAVGRLGSELQVELETFRDNLVDTPLNVEQKREIEEMFVHDIILGLKKCMN
jgi:uncharacterized protein (DUF849 family)